MFRVSCLGIWWRHDIWISENLKFDYLKNEKSFRSEIKTFFLVSQVLSFRHKNQTSKNVVDTTGKVYSIKGQLNLSVNKMNLIVGISKIFFVSKSSLLSANSRIFVIVESLCLHSVHWGINCLHSVHWGIKPPLFRQVPSKPL